MPGRAWGSSVRLRINKTQGHPDLPLKYGMLRKVVDVFFAISAKFLKETSLCVAGSCATRGGFSLFCDRKYCVG